jgi:EpsI family protein
MPTTFRQNTIVALAIAAFGLCYAGVAAALVDKWSTNYIYSYGFAVPLISGYMIWARWPRIQRMAWTPDYLFGVPVALAGATALVIGRVGALLAIQEASLVVTLSGLVLLFFGRRVFRVLSFPILYLFLCIPLWDYPIALFQEPSQTLSARIALGMLHPLGVPALREGTRLVLPTVTLEVLRECSGVNQLVAIVAMTFPAAFLWLESYSRRFALIAIAVITAYLSNGLRIAIIGVLAYNDVKGAHDLGVLHLLQGLVVSSLGYVLIGACLSVLAKTEKRCLTPAEAGTWEARTAATRRQGPFAQVAVICALLAAGSYSALFRPLDVGLRRDLRSIPTVIGDWTVDSTPASTRFAFTGMDDELSRVYRNAAGTRVELYVGYHRYQTQGKEIGGDANRALNSGASSLALRVNSEDLAVRQNDPRSQDNRARVVFWYDVNGRVLPNLYLAKAYNVWDAITTRRTNAAIVIVAWDRDTGADRVAAPTDGIEFVKALVPLLRGFLPAKNVSRAPLLNATAGVAR